MEKIEMITVKEVSKVLGIGINQAYGLVKRDDFPKLKVGMKYLIPKKEFEGWFKNSLYGRHI